MIPQIIHYCWFGDSPTPELARQCIESWHEFMPTWEYRLWNESNFNIDAYPYAREAYDSRKYAFVSDVARLVALNKEGGLYLDVDFKVYRPFDDLLKYSSFAGFEGSKTNPVMMGVIASEPSGVWVREQLELYKDRHFIVNGKEDLTTNVRMITDNMIANGFVPDGQEKDYKDLHILPVDYFCPRQTTGEYFRTENTYCEQVGNSSWSKGASRWKELILSITSKSTRAHIIKLKRKLFG